MTRRELSLIGKREIYRRLRKKLQVRKGGEKEVTVLPPHYIATMPEDVQEEIREKVIVALT